MKRAAFSISLVGISIFLSVSLACADIQTLAEGADYGDALLQNGKGKVHYTFALVDSLSPRVLAEKQQKLSSVQPGRYLVWTNSRDVDISLAFSGVKVWMERKFKTPVPTGPAGKFQIRNWQCAYDGEKVSLLRRDGAGKNGLIRPMGDIRQGQALQSDRYDPRYHANAIQGIPVGAFLRGTAKEGALQNLRITGEETLDGVACQIIEASVANSDVAYKVWIAPGRMYRPVKAEIRNNAGMKVVRNQFRSYGAEVWFPSQVTVEQYVFETGTSAPILDERFALTVAGDFQINAGVSDNLFQLRFPKGLKVYDWRTGTTFTAQ